MSPLAIVLTGLIATSLLVALALALAWQRFGREPHAALWTAGFLAAAAGYCALVVKLVVSALALYAQALAIGCLMASMALLAQGFRQRGGRVARPWLLPALTAGATIVACASLRLPAGSCVPRLIVNSFVALMLTVSAIAVRDGADDSRAPGPVAFWWLLGFAGYSAGLAGVAAAVSVDGPITAKVYLFLFLTGVPAGMTGVGLVTLLLLGGDLAERLHRLAEIDPLTGVLNRRGVERAAARLIALAKRTNRPITIAVADLDRFKAINDRYGHQIGDIVLKHFARHAAEQMRGGDLIGRLGGEEFVFVLVDSSTDQAAEAMDRLRSGLGTAIADIDVPVVLTASFGIAPLGDRSDTFEAMIARADEALYRSKDDGRDRISVARPQHVASDARFRSAWLRGNAPPEAGRARGQAG